MSDELGPRKGRSRPEAVIRDREQTELHAADIWKSGGAPATSLQFNPPFHFYFSSHFYFQIMVVGGFLIAISADRPFFGGRRIP